MKYFIIAGEKSGDMHGSNLCKSIFELDSEALITGWGGGLMNAVGVKVLKNYHDLAFMGFWEVIKNLPKILGFFKEVKIQITVFKPDVVILVDYAGFNLRVAKWAKNSGFKTIYYIAPKAWAWRPGRAKIIKKYIDKLLVIFPFEKEFFEKYGIATEYVGNPLLDEIINFKPNEDFRIQNELNSQPIIALLPGSRKQEIEKMLKEMSKLTNILPQYQWVMAGIGSMEKHIYKTEGANFKLIFDQTYDLLFHSNAAIVTSGTATLETALFNVPQVVVYRTSNFSYQIAKRLINISYISLVNLVSQKGVVKELIQDEYNTENLEKEVFNITKNTFFRENQLKEYRILKEKMGKKGASDLAAHEIYKLAKV